MTNTNIPQLVEYNRLSAEAKQVALKTALKLEKEAIKRLMDERKAVSLHKKISRRFSVAGILRQLNNVKRWENDSKSWEKVVIDNLCHFTKEGFYYVYTQKRLVCDF